ncbi:MAG: glycosyltransferase family 39 protein [Bryobacteraceae bacterium]
MLMTYLGTVKTLVYTAVFQIWTPSPYSIRLPALLLGAATIAIFYYALHRAAGRRAAWIGCALLATDPVFLQTTVFDWGPVAIQHLMLTGGVALLIRYRQTRSNLALAAGFFLFGLGLWDKALFLWMLAGLGVATLAVYPRELWRAVSLRNLGLASAALILGALPLVIYNVAQEGITIRGNAKYSLDPEELKGKAHLLRVTLDGSVLFGWMVRENQELQRPFEPVTPLERAATALSGATGHPRTNWMVAACVLALALLPLLWSTPAWRPSVFALVFLIIAWGQMAVTRNTGGSAHHAVLIWPFPHFLVAVAFAGTAYRFKRAAPSAMAAATILLVISNLLVINTFYAQMVRNRGSLNWSDAIHPLAQTMRTVKADLVFIVDWGMLESLRLLSRGTLPLREGDLSGGEPLDEDSLREFRRRVAHPSYVFVGHTEGREFFPGRTKQLVSIAQEIGYEPEMLHVIRESSGMPIFEVFRFRPVSESQTPQKPDPVSAHRPAG